MSNDENKGGENKGDVPVLELGKFEYWDKVALVQMLDSKRLAQVLADPKQLSIGEFETLRKGREFLYSRRNAIVQGAELDKREKAFVEAQLKKWAQLDVGARKKVDAEVRKFVPPNRLHEDCAKWLRACGIAAHAPLMQPPAKLPISEAEKQLNEKAAKGLLCPGMSCRSPRNKVNKTIKKGNVLVRYRECLACGRSFTTEEKPRT